MQMRRILLQNRQIQLQNRQIHLQMGRILLQNRQIQLQMGQIQLQKPVITVSTKNLIWVLSESAHYCKSPLFAHTYMSYFISTVNYVHI